MILKFLINIYLHLGYLSVDLSFSCLPFFRLIFTFKYASSVAMNFDCNCGGLPKHELEIPLWQFVWPKSKGEKEQRSTTHTVVPPLSLSLSHSHSSSPSHLQLSCVACHLSRFLWASLTWPKNIINFTQRHPQSAVATSLLQVDANSGRGKDMAGAATQLSVHKISRYANQWYILYVRLFVQIALRYKQTSELRISFFEIERKISSLTNVWQLRKSESHWLGIGKTQNVKYTIYNILHIISVINKKKAAAERGFDT